MIKIYYLQMIKIKHWSYCKIIVKGQGIIRWIFYPKNLLKIKL